MLDPLDREITPVHHLRVRASDVSTGLSSDTLVLVQVTDVNDCYPTFLQTEYSVVVMEGVAIGTEIVRVTASDCDSGKVSGDGLYTIGVSNGNCEFMEVAVSRIL